MLKEFTEFALAHFRQNETEFNWGPDQSAPYQHHEFVILPPYNDGQMGYAAVVLRYNEYTEVYSVINCVGAAREFGDKKEAFQFALED